MKEFEKELVLKYFSHLYNKDKKDKQDEEI